MLASKETVALFKTEDGRWKNHSCKNMFLSCFVWKRSDIVWKTNSYPIAAIGQGKRLREMLLKEGTVEAMDVMVTKTHRKSLDETKQGGWYTKGWLMANRSWTKYPA